MSNIPHYLRLKPRCGTSEDEQKTSLVESQTEHEVRFKETTAPNKFTKIFNEISQLELYKETIKDLTEELFDHKDSTFFTLGPSNSGKSYSIYGDDANPGLSIYSLKEIFNKINNNFANYKIFKRHFGECLMITSNSQRDCVGEYGLSISVFEIYNDRIRDLSLDPRKTEHQSLDIITDVRDGKVKPNRIRQIYVTNLDDAKTVIHKCIKRRAVSSTSLNQTSSRSHLFIYFNLHKVFGNTVKTSRLTVADLAGSERTKAAKTEGKEFKEGNYTNTSLTELGRCLSLMRSKKFDRSNLRTSKLTRLLLTDLFGNLTPNRIKILLTLDPFSSLSTIMHAVRYIQPISKVQISERNSVEACDPLLSRHFEEIKMLKAMNEKLKKENELAKDRAVELEMEIRSEVTAIYEEKIEELDILNLKAINELKNSHQKDIDEKLRLLSEDYESKIVQISQEHEQKYHDSQFTERANDSGRIEKENDELRSKIAELEEKLEEFEREYKRLEKKEKKRSKKIDQLTEQLNNQSIKRKSEEFELPESLKKVRFSDNDDKENIDMALSPIKLIRSSPNKHFKFEDGSNKAVSPKKSLVLQASNKDMLESPSKSTSKSPSKGKKKLNKLPIVDNLDDW